MYNVIIKKQWLGFYMSLIISVYTSEGIVMASDSRTTQSFVVKGETKSYPLSDSANKTFLSKWNYGISTCGAASINGLPLSGHIQSFLNTYKYDKQSTTVEKFSDELCDYFMTLDLQKNLIFHVCGYDLVDEQYTQRVYRCSISVNKDVKEKGVVLVNDKLNIYGVIWDGQAEVMLRLIKQQILAPKVYDAKSVEMLFADGTTLKLDNVYVTSKQESSFIPEANIDFNMMNLQDAIDFARFAIRTTIDTQRFLQMEKTVGGPIDVLVIKPQESAWVSSKELK